MRNSNKKTEPIFWFSPNIKNPEPKIRHIMAPTRRIDATGSGIPFEEIYFYINHDQFIKQIIARWQKGQKIFAFLYWI